MPAADVAVRAFVPAALRRRAAGAVGRYRGAQVRRRLAALAAGGRPIIAGPWLGEVGFEILYWAPFLRWFARELGVAGDRLTIVSRGGTASWYGAAGARYRDVFEYVSPAVYREWHDAHRREIGEQKQTRMTGRERTLLEAVAADAAPDAEILHPSMMYELMNPFWWRHLDERWIHRHTVYERLPRPARPAGVALPERYTAAKFYFNDCFPATDENRGFVRAVLSRLAEQGPVVSLAGAATLDDHAGCAVEATGVTVLGDAPPARNLEVQTAVVANAAAFVGTYGGFAYLAPFCGVPATSYYDRPDGFARTHLRMAQSAFRAIGAGPLLTVEPTRNAAAPRERT